ncbi:uncharacterized protein LOC127012146 [Drosophila biarmipes]|uniref:uncharacterized protein LOC127012146 n=1 Tax=Drosophila biarmipes TaxID=125945 RepID=UPI0021CCD4D8|nr:uncharacterized protein LOC127012146 [Drosophila biarmipes]
MAGRSPGTRRIRVVAERRREVGERESLEIEDGERESLEKVRAWGTRDFGERESLETKNGERRAETWRAEQKCRVQKGVTGRRRTFDATVNFGPREKVPHLGSRANERK